MDNMVPFETESLKDYGKQFQQKLSYILLTDPRFFEQTVDILNPLSFDSKANQWLIKKTIWHFNEYKCLPDFDNFNIYIKDEITDKAQRTNVIYYLQKIISQKEKNNTSFIKETALDFFKKQNLSKVILESVNLIKDKKYEEIQAKISNALNAGQDRNLGLNYIEDIDERYNDVRKNIISYGYPAIDNLSGGGIGAGELSVLVAPSGIGKSFLLTHMALRMILNGNKVVYYNLEDNASYIGRRLDSILMKESNENIKYKLDDLKKMIDKKIKANIIVKDFPSQVSNINHFMRHFNRLHLINFKPDVIIIDYGDIIDTIHRQNADWLDQIQKFNELKSMAQQLEIPVITASQAGKQALEKEIVEAQDLQRAYGKVAPAGLVLGITRKISDKLNNTGKIHIAKNRYGPDGITLPAKIDHGKGVFEIYKVDSKLGIDLMKKIENNGDDFEAGMSRIKNTYDKFRT